MTEDEKMMREDKPQDRSGKGKAATKTAGAGFLAYVHDLVYILAAVIVLFLMLFRVVVVSGSSMYDTLLDGDYLLLAGNLLGGAPKQGDIVVAGKDAFRNGEAFVKRVIATEGQTVDIDFDAGIVYVDGVALEEDYTYTPTNLDEGMAFPLVVEEGHLFLMGDNRNGSKDSRSVEIGQVDRREIIGKAIFLIFPGNNEGNDPRDLGRIGGI